ncbi:MAG: transposase [Rhodoferax sp.]|nr:transposase [Rhodoferax sp.]
MGILLTGTVCWAAFERAGLGAYRMQALSWMFCCSKIAWDLLLQASLRLVVHRLGVVEGVLVTDDTDHKRAKRTKRIFNAHKVFDKKTGGYFNGQSLVFLFFFDATDELSRVFRFCPDPKQVAWRKEDERLKRLGTKKSERPAPPPYDPAYPTKEQITLALIADFRRLHPDVVIKAVLADALYGTKSFMDAAASLSGCRQVVSELKSDQNVVSRNRKQHVRDYFAKRHGCAQRIRVRGGQEIEVIVESARLHVCAHEKKRFVIALKYPGETEYRYLVATDLSWRTLDIVQAYTLRWLIEVFFADWKLNEGWGQLAKQPGEEGSSRSLILNLLLDHALLLHPEQQVRLENKMPAWTVGSLKRLTQGEAILECVRRVLTADNPAQQFAVLSEKVKALFPLAPSEKHMSGRDLGRMEPSPSLRKYTKATSLGG